MAYLFVAYFSNWAADYRCIRFEKAVKKDFFDAVIILFSVLVILVPKITGERVAKRNETYLTGVEKYTATTKTLYESHKILDRAGRNTLIRLLMNRDKNRRRCGSIVGDFSAVLIYGIAF